MQASIHPRTSLDAMRPALVYVMILLCALLAGCGASSPPHEAAEAEASPASGAERPTSLEESAVAGDGDATNDGFQSEGGEGPGAPPTEATRTEEDAFERLLQASSRYDVALSQASRAAAWLLLLAEFLRQTCRANGLGEAAVQALMR